MVVLYLLSFICHFEFQFTNYKSKQFKKILMNFIYVWNYNYINQFVMSYPNNFIQEYNNFLKQINREEQSEDLAENQSHLQAANSRNNQQMMSSNINRGSEAYHGSDARTIIDKFIQNKTLFQREFSNNIIIQQQIRFRQGGILHLEKNIKENLQRTNLKLEIQSQNDEAMKLQVERDHLLSKKENNGAKQQQIDLFIKVLSREETKEPVRITYTQLEKINNQCKEMQRKITKLQLKKQGEIDKLLQHQKQYYRTLQNKLRQKKYQLKRNNIDAEEITQLKTQYQHLTQEVIKLQQCIRTKQFDEELDRLRDDNQTLRKKAIQILSCKDRKLIDSEERRQLQQYINDQEQNKAAFLQDLRKFKLEFNVLKEENTLLKQKIKAVNTQQSQKDNQSNQKSIKQTLNNQKVYNLLSQKQQNIYNKYQHLKSSHKSQNHR